jgi:integrase
VRKSEDCEENFHTPADNNEVKPTPRHDLSEEIFCDTTEYYEVNRSARPSSLCYSTSLAQEDTMNETPNAPTLRSLTDQFTLEKVIDGTAEGTLDLWQRTFTRLHALSFDLDDFRRADLITRIKTTAPRTWSRATLTTYLTRCTTFAHWLRHQGFIEHAHKAPSASKRPKLRELPTDEEIGHLLADLADRSHHAPTGRARTRLQDECVTRLLIETGARISETLALEPSSILRDEQGARIVILGSKSPAAERAITITPELSGLLHQYERRWPPPARDLFRSRRDQHISTQTFCKWLHAYCETLGILAPVTPHVLRHRWILKRICAGDSAIEVMTRAGHSSIEMTVYYFNQVRRLMPLDSNAPNAEIERVTHHGWRHPTR